MLKQVLVGLIFTFLLIRCSSHSAAKNGGDSLINQPSNNSQRIASNSQTITIAPALLKKYREACLHDTVSYDKKFISNFIDIISRFNGRSLDTTILRTGNIEGDPDPDSIFTRVYFDADSVYVYSKWVKNNRIRWEDKYADPYTELNADLLDSTRNTWVHFGIGIAYGPPDFYPRNDAVDSGALSSVYNQGVDDLTRIGIIINKEQYKAYLQGFKGDVLTCGQPESRERLWIWYKPAGRMITYYQP